MVIYIFRACNLNKILANSLLAALIVGSCSDVGPKTRIAGPPGSDASVKPMCLTQSVAPAVSWKNEIGPIFTANCGPCHPGSQKTDYSTYAGVKAGYVRAMLYIETGRMPVKGPLSSANQLLIDSWSRAGMPENPPAASGSPAQPQNSNPDCTPKPAGTTGAATNSTTRPDSSSP